MAEIIVSEKPQKFTFVDNWILEDTAVFETIHEKMVHKLNQYVDIHHFPPTIAQIAVEPPLDNRFLKQQQVWAAQVKAEAG
ncbi:hypothetical protein M670_04061 [Schinkia azotoformans MEV2011]|uniref:Uncharacterized protein n=1 Tax=Schinkia azotoformans MEV2011 TaxID=1348973 RepID=A0A072NGH4_SCHAZ|nr:hypothetical protein [Schinkia azotoformans]KEF36809.1 hypothetical protein M670_04061 [Schinkia azotoformans MEV2011]MEC1698172.1 hypothetical protein [Schinkia azotoformans]MEC1725235.1 hypothetical protein [Schinkia azotoformans]MEC1772748.1 hypothetical protein [Schinkia azotoformans]MEC1777955.1 hypothetical protein [Schinkia azotoformans]